MNYYYLGASLPALRMDEKPSISIEEFDLLAAAHLKSSDYSALQDADDLLKRDPQHPFMKDWKARDASLRNALVRARANATKKDPLAHIKQPEEYSSTSEQAVTDAMSRRTPLEKEQALDRHRWSVLDDMATFNPFASEAILAYGLKLRIATRWSVMNKDDGRQMAEKVITTVPAEDDKSDNEAEPLSDNNDNK